MAQVPSDQSRAGRSVVNSAGKPSNGGPEPEESRVQAALMSLEIGFIVVNRITFLNMREGKPTLSLKWKATVSGAIWQAPETPPGSKSGACIQRGKLGTWENQAFPC